MYDFFRTFRKGHSVAKIRPDDVESRIFLGQKDPTRLSLEIIFPYGDVVFSTPVNEVGRQRRVVIEGHETFLDFLQPYLEDLIAAGPDEKKYGQWTTIVPHDPTDGIQIFFRPINKTVTSMIILSFLLRSQLIRVCNLKLSEISQVLGTKDGAVFLSQFVKLPEDIGNGTIEVPAISIAKSYN